MKLVDPLSSNAIKTSESKPVTKGDSVKSLFLKSSWNDAGQSKIRRTSIPRVYMCLPAEKYPPLNPLRPALLPPCRSCESCFDNLARKLASLSSLQTRLNWWMNVKNSLAWSAVGYQIVSPSDPLIPVLIRRHHSYDYHYYNPRNQCCPQDFTDHARLVGTRGDG